MKFDVEKIRQDFPLLKKFLKGRPYIYFDNACMSLRPQSVLNAEKEYYEQESSCAGRSVHKLSEEVNHRVEQVRKLAARFINAKSEKEIIFTKNTTEGLNLVARGWSFNEGDKIFTTDKEHNSNLVPWLVLAKEKHLIHKIIPSKNNNVFDLETFKELIEQERPRFVSLGMTSNLDGVTIPAKEIIKISHQSGACVMLDAAQAAPHQKIDVLDLDVDFLAFSGHKMLGPTATGILYGKKELLDKLEPLVVGGGNLETSFYDSYKFLGAPQKFEAGLQNYAGIYGLGEAIIYLEELGFDNIKKRELELNKFITEAIGNFPQIKMIGPKEPGLRGGIISFYVDNFDSREIALMFDQLSNIAIRSGQHCVHSWFNHQHLSGSARASFYFYNTLEEAKIFVETLEKILKLKK
ncbi:MAG TPA: aminotransferase class V-fold PLP-dependent enzyme [Candidatus Paceibacterota bacterium]|nr:aminotransferase class V-fold PLP-dependent enzyme [Candidatus Paceibacterota bacterium]